MRKREISSGHLSGENSRSSGANQVNTVYIGNSNLNRIAASFVEIKPTVNSSVYAVSENTMNPNYDTTSNQSNGEAIPNCSKCSKQPTIGLMNNTLLAANYEADKELQSIIRMMKQEIQPRSLGMEWRAV